MKVIKWIGHPVVLVIVYLLLVIEGDNFGGYYLLYLILSLPHGVPYAVVAALGIAGMVIAFNIHSRKYELMKYALYLVGFALMIISLVMFFETGYSWNTFKLTVPLSTFILFGIISFCFLARTVWLFLKMKVPKNHQMKMI